MPQESKLLPESQRDFSYASFADSPTLRARWLVGIAIVVPVLVATGVFWLHSLPGGALRELKSDGTVEVSVVGAAQTIEVPQKQIVQLRQAPAQAKPAHVSVTESKVAALETEVPAAETPTTSATQPQEDGGASAIPMPSHKAGGRAVSMFQRVLFTHIARYEAYPDDARRNRLQGQVELYFSMRRDGTVTDIEVASSSGHVELDDAAIDTIKRAEPLPRIPASLPDSLNIVIPMAFDLP
jgi:periplasmic protein TonB